MDQEDQILCTWMERKHCPPTAKRLRMSGNRMGRKLSVDQRAGGRRCDAGRVKGRKLGIPGEALRKCGAG